MTNKKKDKILLEELRDEITTLNGRITNLEEELRALTFYHVNPNGLVFSPSCDVIQDTAQWIGGKVFNHRLSVTFIDPKTMRVITRELIRHHGQLQLNIGRYNYDLNNGHLTVYVTVTDDKEVREFKIEHNLLCFCAPNIATVSVRTETNPLQYEKWIKIPACIDRGTIVFS